MGNKARELTFRCQWLTPRRRPSRYRGQIRHFYTAIGDLVYVGYTEPHPGHLQHHEEKHAAGRRWFQMRDPCTTVHYSSRCHWRFYYPSQPVFLNLFLFFVNDHSKRCSSKGTLHPGTISVRFPHDRPPISALSFITRRNKPDLAASLSPLLLAMSGLPNLQPVAAPERAAFKNTNLPLASAPLLSHPPPLSRCCLQPPSSTCFSHEFWS